MPFRLEGSVSKSSPNRNESVARMIAVLWWYICCAQQVLCNDAISIDTMAVAMQEEDINVYSVTLSARKVPHL